MVVHVAGVRRSFPEIRGSVILGSVLLAWDVLFTGSMVLSTLVCPVWFLVSLLRGAIHRPGWGLALAWIGIPTLTLAIVRINDTIQRGVAEVNSRRIVAACEDFHVANGRFPKTLDELVPQYMDSVPVAKYCLGPGCRFLYIPNAPLLVWEVVTPYYRKIYNFNSRTWSYID
ncbi:MAG: hypothetical protein BGO49_22735 [Planctomycetales bacterium 71-10]|nr:MAG: hypothetical protein BGO49_22735 [Planctomycetales bacterium 71-10]